MNFHGGQCPNEVKLDFSVNIPRLPYSEKLKNTWIQSIDKLYDYPEIDGKTARDALAKRLNVSTDHLLLGNGATDLIYLITRVFSFKCTMILEPTFTEYRRALMLQPSEVLSYAYREVTHEGLHRFEVDPIKLAESINARCCDALFVCNPNNPTGQLLSADFFKVLLAHIENPTFTLIIDESFIDFCKYGTYLEEMKCLAKNKKIIQLRSMTKTYAVPGLRIGYLVAQEMLIQKLIAHREPWSLNRFALDSIPVLISDAGHLSAIRSWCQEEYDYLKTALMTFSELHVYESDANFILIKLIKGDPDAFHKALMASGIYLRTCCDFEGLGATYFRIAIRQRNDHLELLKILRRIFNVY